MANKTVYLETFGCQMNVLDSELVLGQLRRAGYSPTADAQQADLALLNTCSVREHAEQKVYSRLGELGRIKRRRPDLIVGLIGCMAERDAGGIRRRMPHVDVLCGPGRLNELPAMIEQVRATGQPAVAVSGLGPRRVLSAEGPRPLNDIEALDMARQPSGNVTAYVRVQRGCDKFCSFCVVPFVRGPERSRPPANVVEEARRLADAGTRQLTLLGQTINSYAYRHNGRLVGLADLLEQVHKIEGIERIKFITCYPGGFDDQIFQAMRDLPKVCEYLHMPAQSGSNAVLRRMHRRYTIEQYDELIARARQMVPGISIAGDFIVGFPGETEADFAATCELLERTRYKNIFVFRYSPRPGTAAARRLHDDVPLEVKRRRNSELLGLQRRISLEMNRQLVGQSVEVLVEGPSQAARRAQASQAGRRDHCWRDPAQLTGRTRGHQIVVFDGDASLIGQLVQVTITSASALTLHGRLAGKEA